jgi:selenocysteine lyase/cysteine desulfurase
MSPRHILAVHIRGGYVLALTCIPAVALVMVSLDLIRADRSGLDTGLALASWPEAAALFQVASSAFTFTVIIPILLTPLVALSRGRLAITRALRSRTRLWSILAVVLSSCASYSVIPLTELQKLSGYRIFPAAVTLHEFAFRSYYLSVETRLPAFLLWLMPIAVTAIGLSTKIFGIPRQQTITDYIAFLENQALPTRFAPLHGRKKINFNAGGLAPLLVGVDRDWRSQLSAYQKSVPGSDIARKFLEECWSDCKDLLKPFGIVGSAGRQLRLFSGTSRALERALAEFPPDAEVLISPYEHHSEALVSTANRSVAYLKVSPDFLSLPWTRQREELLNGIAHHSAKVNTEQFILLLSEVCWATGFRVPVDQIVPEIRQACKKARPVIVIDGAHAVGNALPPHPVDVGDAYIFSGHKWLLAPEPCGALISNRPKPIYDAWVERTPDTSVGPSYVCGLRAALRLLGSLPATLRAQRVDALRKRLLRSVSETLTVTGPSANQDATGILTFRPHQGYRWKGDVVALTARFQASGIHVLILDNPSVTGDEEPWIRISLPFFSDWGEVVTLGKTLRHLVTRTF